MTDKGLDTKGLLQNSVYKVSYVELYSWMLVTNPGSSIMTVSFCFFHQRVPSKQCSPNGRLHLKNQKGILDRSIHGKKWTWNKEKKTSHWKGEIRKNANLRSNWTSIGIGLLDTVSNFFTYIPPVISFEHTANHHNWKRAISICN